jgi:hypothetical protein
MRGDYDRYPGFAEDSDGRKYCGNVNSSVFHYADCYWVGKMHPDSRVYADDREGYIEADYVPCEFCRP